MVVELLMLFVWKEVNNLGREDLVKGRNLVILRGEILCLEKP